VPQHLLARAIATDTGGRFRPVKACHPGPRPSDVEKITMINTGSLAYVILDLSSGEQHVLAIE
jgi:hypothetical protein